MEDREARLHEVARIAAVLEVKTGCPAQLLVAQWAVESDWGAKPVGRFNCFGMKRAARHAQGCFVPTREVVDGRAVVLDLEFADYDSLEDSCKDYAWLITNGRPYHAAWEQFQCNHDLTALITAVAHVYASDPGYAHLVAEIAGQKDVVGAIAQARLEVAA